VVGVCDSVFVSLTEKMEAKSSNFFLQKCFFKISIGAN
jgi:hypothetical protein